MLRGIVDIGLTVHLASLKTRILSQCCVCSAYGGVCRWCTIWGKTNT